MGIALEIYSGSASQDPRGSGVPGARTPAPVGDRLTSKQLAAIHGVARREGITRDELMGLLVARTGKERVELLTRAEASSIIDALSSPGSNGAHP